MKWIFLLASLSFVQMGCAFFSSVYKNVMSKLNYEFCDDNFIGFNLTQLHMNLKEMLFGQEIIIEKLVPILENHFRHEPKKALVICMHGWTGSGKNYATKIIVDALYKKKFDSSFVHMFNGRLHFPLDIREHVNKYKENIQNWIRGNVTNCERSMFVFDEVDKMPAGIVDAIKPFLDYHEKIDLVNFRKSIFIFISNIGADVINSQYMNLWRQGKSRVDMKYKDFEPFLRNALYKTKGAFKDSAILEGHLVSLYLPFLPLVEEQVKQCIEAEIARQNVGLPSNHDINLVLEEMEFNSDGFSTSGCKRVADLVASMKFRFSDEL